MRNVIVCNTTTAVATENLNSEQGERKIMKNKKSFYNQHNSFRGTS